MSRLFAVVKTIDEIAAHFGVDDPRAISVSTETIEGTRGLIVTEKDGRHALLWVFLVKPDRCAGTVIRRVVALPAPDSNHARRSA